MKIIKPGYEILTEINRDSILKHIERVGRTCYKSEEKITDSSASKFVSNLVQRGHLAMIEFFDIEVKFVCNRGFSHEMVRQRLCSFAQESTRYCNYSKDKFENEITVIEPYWAKDGDKHAVVVWKNTIKHIEDTYFKMLECGLPPQGARGILPIDLKTEIIVKANLREWLHVFKLRCDIAAHPDMRRLMTPLKEELAKELPEIYGQN